MGSTVWNDCKVNQLLKIIKPKKYECELKKDHVFFMLMFDHYIMYAESVDSSTHPDDVSLDKKLMKSAYRIMKTMLVGEDLHRLIWLHRMIKVYSVEDSVELFIEDHKSCLEQ